MPTGRRRLPVHPRRVEPSSAGDAFTEVMFDYRWRDDVADHEIDALITSYGDPGAPGWWDKVRPHSLGWATAHVDGGTVVGFVNVAWDGSHHAFLLDPRTHADYRRQGIAKSLVDMAVRQARDAGCEWIHVDFEGPLGPFYIGACGFEPTNAGLIHLTS
jgi:ribosomal protein S18 acetylase RimI-like enzyme